MAAANCLKIKEGMLIYKLYEPLLNAFLLDFYTENHWNLLLNSWKDFFSSITFSELAQILNYERRLRSKKILPLSVIALNTLLRKINLPRYGKQYTKRDWDLSDDPLRFKNIANGNMFWKNIKLKKRHEIMGMSEITYDCSISTNCLYIVDIGSGLGHFSRILSYVYGLKTCAIEMKETLTNHARQFNKNFERSMSKQKQLFLETSPIHITKRIDENITSIEFISMIRTAFGIITEELRFGIVGLHPCGDLGPILIRIFNSCLEAKFINIVGCCYMKLSTDSEERPIGGLNVGFPMSEYCLKNNYSLPYNALEVACHAVENYIDKLQTGNINDLKIHSFRGVLEKLLKIHCPQFCHRQLGNVKYKNELKFEKYCQKALRAYEDVNIEGVIINTTNVQADLSKWPQVVVFHSLRLLFAPLIESIILYDRLLFLNKNNKCKIIPEFDPRLSPRNQVLVALKE